MSLPRAKSDIKRHGRQFSALDPLNDQGETAILYPDLLTRPRGIRRKQSFTPFRKSARLQEKQRLRRQLESQERPKPPSNPYRKRKRSHESSRNCKTEAGEVDHPLSPHKDEPSQKRRRTQPANCAVQDTSSQAAASSNSNSNFHLRHWAQKGSWPREYFEQDSNISQSLTRKRSTPSLSKQESDISGVSLREGKNPAVRSRRYQQILESVGICIGQPEPHLRAAQTDKALCQELLKKEQPVPKDSLFNDDLFESTCEDIANRNEARVIQDIGRLIVPAPEELFRRGVKHLKHLIETVDESWIKSIPLVKGPRPQPDFAVGLKSSAFTSEQLKKLQPSIGDWKTTSRLVATDEMYFPLLTAEVKCGNEALNIADRQNAHSAAVAANTVVELYRLVSRQDELNQKILTYSISHDNEAVRIYGHYALIKEKQTLFYRYPVDKLNFTRKDGKEKWTPYTFTRNVYDKFYPIHHERICSAVDQLPNPEDFAVESFSQQSNFESFEQNDSQLTNSYSQQTEPELPSSQTSEPVFKKPKGKGIKDSDLQTNTSVLFSNDVAVREVKWLGIGNQVIWLKDVNFGGTEIWIGDADDAGENINTLKMLSLPVSSHCAGRIDAKATYLKIQKLHNEYKDIAIALSCPATSNGNPHNSHKNSSSGSVDGEVYNAIWYTTLRKKALRNSTVDTKYIVSPTKFNNPLRGTGLESPLRSPFGTAIDFDISNSGIVFLTKGTALDPPTLNVYYIPLKTFTEVSRPRPQIISVKGFEGGSSNPVFSPNGNSVAFLKKQNFSDTCDRNRVIVIHNIRDFRAHMSIDNMPTQQSERDWHLSPYSVSWSENGQELYVVAVEVGIRKLYKIPATLSSIKQAPTPITSDNTTPADIRHLRMVFSAPMDAIDIPSA